MKRAVAATWNFWKRRVWNRRREQTGADHSRKIRPVLRDGKIDQAQTENLNLAGEGLFYRPIGGTPGLSLGTVRTHLQRSYEKLQVRTRMVATVNFLGMRSDNNFTGCSMGRHEGC
ncbi:MAG: hypothetical protein P4N60_03860 [Verrucomicrobiae bacterium]|nr:hypothetical protein [Verrucomicrobiae bacterium]